MTPIELLEDVKQRFPVLLHDNEKDLRVLLMQALRAYQSNAGVEAKLVSKEPVFALPNDYREEICTKDANGDFVCSLVDHVAKTVTLELETYNEGPYTFQYLQRLDLVDFSTGNLPYECVELVSDMLEVLIAVPNSQRLARVSQAGQWDDSHIPQEENLRQRKTEIEQAMKDRRCTLPLISIFPR